MNLLNNILKLKRKIFSQTQKRLKLCKRKLRQKYINFAFKECTHYQYSTKRLKKLKYRVLTLESRVENARRNRDTQKRDIKKLTDTIEELRKKIPEADREKLTKWARRVKQVGRCDVCGSSKDLTAHHLWDKKSHFTMMYQDENGVCLCDVCHKAFHRMYKLSMQTTPKMYQKFKVLKRNGYE